MEQCRGAGRIACAQLVCLAGAQTRRNVTEIPVNQEEEIQLKEAQEFHLDASIKATYEIQGTLGKGGFGEVYKATHKALKNTVALKVVSKDVANSEMAMKRLGQEARVITTLNNENIVGVREFGTGNEGSAYLVMDYIEGHTLADELKKGPVSVSSALFVAAQVCHGLIHAHSKGILHRDLKPGNIMLTSGWETKQAGSVKIVDFGIAKIREDGREQNLTQTGDIVGSPLYMSPEQGLGHHLDERADIYALGCVMYELLAGKVPFRGDNAMQTLVLHVNKPAEPLSSCCPDRHIPKNLQDVVMKMLEKDPNQRYKTVSDLLADLDLIGKGKEPVGLSKAKSPKKKLNPWGVVAAIAGGIIISTLVALLILLLAYFNQSPWSQQIQKAHALKTNGNYQMAKQVLRKSLSEAIAAAAADRDKAAICGELANLCRDQDSFAEAKSYYKEAVEYATKSGDQQRLAQFLDDLALSQNETGESKIALENNLKALSIKEKLYGENSFFTSNSLQKLSKIYYTLGQYSESEKCLLRARKIETVVGGEKTVNMAVIDWFLAKAFMAQDKPHEAQHYYDECVSIREQLLGPDDKELSLIKSKYQKLLKMPSPKVIDMFISGPGQEEAK